MTNPYFVITAGVTGAGKTSLIDETVKYLNITEPYVKILVDDLVENDSRYKTLINDIIKDVLYECSKTDEDISICEQNTYNNPSDGLYKRFSDAYYSTRTSTGCNGEPLTCDDLNDVKLIDAIKNNNNIVFEMTGSYIPTWVLNPTWIPSHYIIIMTYSLVSLGNLIKRNKSRAYDTIQTFKRNNALPAPRLPNVSREIIVKTALQIYDVLLNLYDSCILTHDTEICGERKIDQLLLFDNNEKSFQLKFDSTIQTLNKEDFNELISQSFGITSDPSLREGGRRKNKRSTKKRTNKRAKKHSTKGRRKIA